MAIRPLCELSHQALRQSAQPITHFSHEVRQLAHDLIDTMYAHDGIGLAAPQIGRSVQMFVANPTQRRGQELILVNPVLQEHRGRHAIVEGCLSLPNVWERVRRAARVWMSGCDLSGKPLEIHADGLLAIVLQHEFDHLQGHLLIDRLSWFRRRRLARLKGIRVRPCA